MQFRLEVPIFLLSCHVDGWNSLFLALDVLLCTRVQFVIWNWDVGPFECVFHLLVRDVGEVLCVLF